MIYGFVRDKLYIKDTEFIPPAQSNQITSYASSRQNKAGPRSGPSQLPHSAMRCQGEQGQQRT